MHLMTDSSETKTHLGGDTRGSPRHSHRPHPHFLPHTRSFQGPSGRWFLPRTPRGRVERDDPTHVPAPAEEAAVHPSSRARSSTPAVSPNPRGRPTRHSPSTNPRFPDPRHGPAPRGPGVPSGTGERHARSPSGRREAWPPSRDPHRLTTGAARTHRGLRPTQAWLLLRAAPAQRHLLRTLTQLLGPPCETGTTACCRLSLPLCRRLLVRARDRGHNRSDVSRAPAEQRLLSRSPGRAPRAGARCICKETAAHWPAGGGACGARPIKCRPGERGAGGRGGARLLWVILRSRRRLDPTGALAGRGLSPWGGERRDGPAATAAAEGSWAGGAGREDQRRPGCPR